MMKLWTWLKGKKTYIVCAITILWAWVGVALAMHGPETAIQVTLAALTAAGLRHGMK